MGMPNAHSNNKRLSERASSLSTAKKLRVMALNAAMGLNAQKSIIRIGGFYRSRCYLKHIIGGFTGGQILQKQPGCPDDLS